MEQIRRMAAVLAVGTPAPTHASKGGALSSQGTGGQTHGEPRMFYNVLDQSTIISVYIDNVHANNIFHCSNRQFPAVEVDLISLFRVKSSNLMKKIKSSWQYHSESEMREGTQLVPLSDIPHFEGCLSCDTWEC